MSWRDQHLILNVPGWLLHTKILWSIPNIAFSCRQRHTRDMTNMVLQIKSCITELYCKVSRYISLLHEICNIMLYSSEISISTTVGVKKKKLCRRKNLPDIGWPLYFCSVRFCSVEQSGEQRHLPASKSRLINSNNYCVSNNNNIIFNIAVSTQWVSTKGADLLEGKYFCDHVCGFLSNVLKDLNSIGVDASARGLFNMKYIEII